MVLAGCDHQLAGDVLNNHVRFVGLSGWAISRFAVCGVSGKGADERIRVLWRIARETYGHLEFYKLNLEIILSVSYAVAHLEI
jgi:hypothetical protein